MARANDIKNAIGEIQNHYEKNLNNKYVKKFTINLNLSSVIIQNMNLILGSNFVYIDTKAIQDLYYGVKAVCDFISEIQSKVIPDIMSHTSASTQTNLSDNDKILYQMALKNYPMNIKILSDQIVKFFNLLVEYDNETFPKDPAYYKIDKFEDFKKNILSISTKV